MKKIALLFAAALLAAAPLQAQTHIREEVGGYQIGRTASEKFSLWGVWPPVPQQSATNDLIQSLQNIGILSSGTAPLATPLNLNGGALTAGSIVLGSSPMITGRTSPIGAATVAIPGTFFLMNSGTTAALYLKLSGTAGTGWGLVTTGTGP